MIHDIVVLLLTMEKKTSNLTILLTILNDCVDHVITCRNTSYYGLLSKTMKPKRGIKCQSCSFHHKSIKISEYNLHKFPCMLFSVLSHDHEEKKKHSESQEKCMQKL